MKNSGSILAVPRTASYFLTILAVLLMTSCTICRADQDNIRADVTSDTLKSAEGRGLSGDMVDSSIQLDTLFAMYHFFSYSVSGIGFSATHG